MSKAVEFLNENPIQYLATVGRDGKAKCRPFMFAGEVDGKLWFCTNNTKDVYKEGVIDFKKRQTVVKALCLHIAHDCNLHAVTVLPVKENIRATALL